MCRDLPVELHAATRLTSLLLQGMEDTKLPVLPSSLPRSLRRLRLTEEVDGGAAMDWLINAQTVLRSPPDFAGLDQLQDLQLTVHPWGVQRLPTG